MLRVAQVGLRGFGRIHLERIDAMVAAGRVELVAGADPAGPMEPRVLRSFDSLTELLAHCQNIDIVSIATPISTHVALAEEALQAGAHVMLEKPPVASLAQFQELVDMGRTHGKAIQVGFQSLGGAGVARMRQLCVSGELGDITSIQVWGHWVRDLAYFKRARWAGHRTLDGVIVADGVCTNALAHAIATACAIVQVRSLADVVRIDTELYRCFDTETDDTSWMRIWRCDKGEYAPGVPIDVALTLCGDEQLDPRVALVGTRGRAELGYTKDVVTLTRDQGTTVEQFGRMDLFENLVDHVDRGVPLLVPLEETVGFMCALQANQTAPAPAPIGGDHVTWLGEGDARHPVLTDILSIQKAALDGGSGYLKAGAPWGDASACATWVP